MVAVVPFLTAGEQRALIIRIDGSQTVERMPDYTALLVSARAKLVAAQVIEREHARTRPVTADTSPPSPAVVEEVGSE